MNVAFIILLTIIPFFPGFIGSSYNAAALGEVSAIITLSQDRVTAELNPAEGEMVSFTGDVTVQADWIPSMQYIVVDLSPNAGDWVTSTPPPLVFSKQSKSQQFYVSVKVPEGTEAFEERTFRLSGTWYYTPGSDGGECVPDTAIIFVDQYFMIVPSTPKIEYSAKPGDTIDMEIYLYNRGNGPDIVYLTDSVQPESDFADLGTRYRTNEVEVSVNANVSTMVSVKLRDDISNGKKDIIFRAYSTIADERGRSQDPLPLTVTIDVKDESLLEKYNVMTTVLPISGIIILVVVLFIIVYMIFIRKRQNKIEKI
jgi:hypothetical protein